MLRPVEFVDIACICSVEVVLYQQIFVFREALGVNSAENVPSLILELMKPGQYEQEGYIHIDI